MEAKFVLMAIARSPKSAKRNGPHRGCRLSFFLFHFGIEVVMEKIALFCLENSAFDI